MDYRAITFFLRHWAAAIVCLCGGATLLFFACYNINIEHISFLNPDGFILNLQQLNVFESIKTGNYVGIFRVHLNYGLLFHYINFLLTAPLIAINSQYFVLVPRILSVCFLIGSMLCLYKIGLRLNIKKMFAVLLMGLFFCSPTTKMYGISFFSQYYMCFFVLLSMCFFLSDNYQFKNKYLLACLCLGAAVGAKVQALSFLPLIGVYCIHPIIHNWSWTCIKIQGVRLVKGSLAGLVVILCSYPYLLSPIGFYAFWRRFTYELSMNVGVDISNLIDRVLQWNTFYPALFGLCAAICLLNACYCFFLEKKLKVSNALAIIVAINIGYNVFFMSWGYPYYGFIAFLLMPLWLILVLQRIRYLRKICGVLLVLLLVYPAGIQYNTFKTYLENMAIKQKIYEDKKSFTHQALRPYNVAGKYVLGETFVDLTDLGIPNKNFIKNQMTIGPRLIESLHNNKWKKLFELQSKYNIGHWKIMPWVDKDIILLHNKITNEDIRKLLLEDELSYNVIAQNRDIIVLVKKDIELKSGQLEK